MKIILASLLIGAAGGIIGPLFGVGGGIIMVPAFVQFLGMPIKSAVATSLAIILVTSAVSTWRYGSTTDLIDWQVMALGSIGTVAAALLSTEWMKAMNSQVLIRVFGVFVILIGISMLAKSFLAKPPKPPRTAVPDQSISP